MGHPPGSVIIASSDLTRYAAFSRSLACLLQPPGTKLVWSTGSDICNGFNQALDSREGEWVWILGDDHVFAPDLLIRLLDRQVDVVSPVVTSRRPPFRGFVFRQDGPELVCVPTAEWPDSGCHAYDGCSGAGMLIRSHVLDKLERPYYEAGKIRAGELNEDTYLMWKMRTQAGASIYVDFDVAMGHQTPAVIWPVRTAQGWAIEGDVRCVIPETAEVPCR